MGENTTCYLCNSINIRTIHKGTRDNNNIDVLECYNCGLVFLSSFSHISDNAYENSEMLEGKVNIDDQRRKTEKDDNRRYELLKNIIRNKKVLDFGCGNGGFIEKAAGIVNVIDGVELELKERNYLINKGYDIYKNIDEVNLKYDIITLFHVLEHLKNPVDFLKKFIKLLNHNGKIIIEVPNSNDALLRLYNSKAFADFTYWSFHLFLYNEDTLALLADISGMKVEWIKQVQRYPLSNHLYWLAKNMPGGHEQWSFIDTKDINRYYENSLASIKSCDTIIACFSKSD